MSALNEDEDNVHWLENFHATHGRPLRVLHCGNIANNAYLNAKFLRKAGIEADVYCGELYHVMASAEWEDIDIIERYGDDFAPDFSPRVVGDYGRPNWFFQGPLHLAVSYYAIINSVRPIKVRYQAIRELQKQGRSLDRAKDILDRCLTELRRVGLNALADYILLFAKKSASVVLGIGAPHQFNNFLQHKRNSVGEFEKKCEALIDEFKRVFPSRPDKLKWTDLQHYSGSFVHLRNLFSLYDIIQAYSTDPILPMIAGFDRYVAFEHGTLRDFIRGDLEYHRLTALAYRKSAHVFITNGDCFEHADWLGCSNVSAMIHPVDVEFHRKRDEVEIARLRAKYDADVILFCPLRHDWAVKGTDVHLRALPLISRIVGKRVALVLTPWGEQIEESRQLIRTLGCEHMVRWLDHPLARPSMVRHIQASDVVLDQMALPHFGATAPQALAAGTPVVMSYRHESVERIVSEPAPILSAFSSEDVAQSVVMALDPGWIKEFKQRSEYWIDTQHHPSRIVRDHVKVYRKILENS